MGACYTMLPKTLESTIAVHSDLLRGHTDVFIMCGIPLQNRSIIDPKIKDIRKVTATIDTDVSRALIGMHAYTPDIQI